MESEVSAPTITANIDGFNEAAAHSGYFLGWRDPDDVIRRTVMAVTAGGRLFPSLPLEMARIGLSDDLEATLDDKGEIASVRLARAGRTLPVSRRGVLPINFLGPGYHQGAFPWVPAMQLIGDDDTAAVVGQRCGRRCEPVGKGTERRVLCTSCDRARFDHHRLLFRACYAVVIQGGDSRFDDDRNPRNRAVFGMP